MKLRVSHQAYGALIVTVESSGTILLTTDVFKETPQLWNLFGGYAHGDIHSSSVFDKATHFWSWLDQATAPPLIKNVAQGWSPFFYITGEVRVCVSRQDDISISNISDSMISSTSQVGDNPLHCLPVTDRGCWRTAPLCLRQRYIRACRWRQTWVSRQLLGTKMWSRWLMNSWWDERTDQLDHRVVYNQSCRTFCVLCLCTAFERDELIFLICFVYLNSDKNSNGSWSHLKVFGQEVDNVFEFRDTASQ